MKRLALASLVCMAALLMLGGTAFAESDECTELARKFEEAPKADVSSAKLERATESRDEGTALCAEGRGAGGVRALKEALRLIGVKDAR